MTFLKIIRHRGSRREVELEDVVKLILFFSHSCIVHDLDRIRSRFVPSLVHQSSAPTLSARSNDYLIHSIDHRIGLRPVKILILVLQG